MVEYENEINVGDQNLVPTQVDSDVDAGAESVKTLSTGETVALVGLAALGAAWVIEKAVQAGKWIGKKVDEYRENKKLRQPEEEKPVEPTDAQVVDAATE